MALFNRDYDRNYGYRGAERGGRWADPGIRGYDRDMGGRGESTWENMKRGTRDFFGMDNRYDRGYGYDRDMNSTYNRGTMGGGGYGGRGFGGNDRDTGYSSTPGYGTDYGARNARGAYDRPYWGHDTWRYDEHYKSRQQTDAGDPFGDRQSGTPIRVVDEPRDRGGWFGGGRGGYDRDVGYDRTYRGDRGFGAGRSGYGSDYHSANPAGYDPYDNRGGDTNFRNRGYDRNWF